MPLLNLAGKKFGSLEVLNRAKENTKRGGSRWICLCRCGRQVTRSSRSLRRYNSPSCGECTTPIIERFWNKVEKTETCWLWKPALTRPGRHGQIWDDKTDLMEEAHRISWEIINGPIPENLCVLHRCDNPPCVRPDHLYLGTKLDNALDRKERKRHWIDRNPEAAVSHLKRISPLGVLALKEGRKQ